MRKEWTKEEDENLYLLYKEKLASEIAQVLGRTESSVQARVNRLGLKKGHRKYGYNDQYFDVPNLENSYWAGIIAADGWVRKSGNTNYLCFALKGGDKYHVQRFADALGYNGPVKERLWKGYISAIVEVCGCDGLVDTLRDNFKIVPRKSLILKPPSLDGDLRLAFIKGYWDGDGCIRFEKNRLEISCTGTIKLLRWIQRVFDEIVPPAGRMQAKARQRKNRKVADYKVTGARAYAITQVLLALDVPGLVRKWKQLENFKLQTRLVCHKNWYSRFGG